MHNVVQEYDANTSCALARKQLQQATDAQDGIHVALQGLDSGSRYAYAVVEVECR